jgi:hypothetical protein
VIAICRFKSYSDTSRRMMSLFSRFGNLMLRRFSFLRCCMATKYLRSLYTIFSVAHSRMVAPTDYMDIVTRWVWLRKMQRSRLDQQSAGSNQGGTAQVSEGIWLHGIVPLGDLTNYGEPSTACFLSDSAGGWWYDL